jgi:hypothetical protein
MTERERLEAELTDIESNLRFGRWIGLLSALVALVLMYCGGALFGWRSSAFVVVAAALQVYSYLVAAGLGYKVSQREVALRLLATLDDDSTVELVHNPQRALDEEVVGQD